MKSQAAETAGQTGLSGLSHRFVARLADGVVGLSVPGHCDGVDEPRGREVLDAARALAQVEPWLQALEDWLGLGLVPELASPSTPWDFQQHATGTAPSLDLTVHLPLSALQAAATAPPAPLAEWSWQTLHFDLLVDTVPLKTADVQALEVGALLLLPAAFGTQWHGRLRPVSGQGSMYGARLYEQRGRLRVAAQGTVASPPPKQHAAVRFVHPLEVKLQHLLGWSTGKVPALDAPQLTEAGALIVEASALVQTQPLATGQLVPVGSGFAVHIGGLPGAAPRVPEAVPFP